MTTKDRSKFYLSLREHFFLLAKDLEITPVEAVGALTFLSAEVTTGALIAAEGEEENDD
jgi:hypothetical protein